MQIESIVQFWSQQTCDPASGQWLHPADTDALAGTHSFNLDYPVSPYIGHVETAKLVILGANAGYSPEMTPSEFPTKEAVEAYVRRVRTPEDSDWSFVSKYYSGVNYRQLILDGEAVLVNACPYRSPKISDEPENRKIIERLPSVAFNRRWLIEAVLPLAQTGKRFIVAKRAGLWKLPPIIRSSAGVAFDPAPVSPQITSTAWSAARHFLSQQG